MKINSIFKSPCQTIYVVLEREASFVVHIQGAAGHEDVGKEAGLQGGGVNLTSSKGHLGGGGGGGLEG